MIKYFLTLVFVLLFSQSGFCQTPGLESEKWNEAPTYHPIESKYANDPAYYIYNKKKVEYIDDNKNSVLEYFTQHVIIHLNDSHGIEYFNKIYIAVNDFTDVTEVRARTILPNGKVIELNKDNIKDLKDENGTLYKIFAMEGLEKDCEVEYYFTMINRTNYFGKSVIQGKFPVVYSEFDLIAPSRLVFDTKMYECDSKKMIDTLSNGKTSISFKFSDIPGAEEEKYSSYNVSLARVEFKLSYNNAKEERERLFTWNELAKRLYGNYSSCTEKELKKVASLVSENGWDKVSGDSVKITTVENYIKKNIIFKKDLEAEQADNLEVIIKTKTAEGLGLMRLYGAIFNNLNIEYQFILSADRDDEVIDRNFENWDNCNYPMFYFPKEGTFIAPTKTAFRYPFIYPSWGNTNALYCKNITIGSMNSAIAEIKKVPLLDYQHSYINLDSKLRLNTNLDTLQIDMKMLYGGYAAAPYRDNFDFLTPEQTKEFLKEIAKRTIGSETIPLSELENATYENGNASKPFIIHLKVNSGDLLEKAGNKILVKIGLVIGPQTEMYQEKERRLPITVEFAHYEQRKIEFVLPKGYSIKNPGDLKMNQVFKDQGVQTMGFVSDYEIKDNILTVQIMEDYRNTYYPLSQYEDFKKIINASSDFNKVVLVLEKTNQ
jgi:hypothetical protein